jgi:23S rRNA pseudouridine2605 synthase
MRLNKFIAKAGITSRRKADILIEKGKVKINGEIVTELGKDIDAENSVVEINGKTLSIERPLLVALNKPPDYVTSLEDRFAAHLVTELVKDIKLRLFPIGRLDKDAEGLLLLTNNGDIAYRLTHPKFEMEKEYLVWVDRNIDWSKIKPLESGIQWEEDTLTAKQVELLEPRKVRIILTEGKKREIKNMMRAIGCRVVRLQRIRIGNMKLGDLELGKYRIYKIPETAQSPYDYFLSLIVSQ